MRISEVMFTISAPGSGKNKKQLWGYAGKTFQVKSFASPRTPFKSIQPAIFYPSPKFLKEGCGEETSFKKFPPRQTVDKRKSY